MALAASGLHSGTLFGVVPGAVNSSEGDRETRDAATRGGDGGSTEL